MGLLRGGASSLWAVASIRAMASSDTAKSSVASRSAFRRMSSSIMVTRFPPRAVRPCARYRAAPDAEPGDVELR